jgi:predicted nuclease with RNAse H fold
MFNFSPEDVHVYPKADKRKIERKVRTKEKNIVATSTPEMKSMVQKKKKIEKSFSNEEVAVCKERRGRFSFW